MSARFWTKVRPWNWLPSAVSEIREPVPKV